MKKIDKPKIRFQGFEEAWAQKTLGEMCLLVNRSSLFSDAPVMMISANNGFISQNERYSYFNAGQSLKKYTLLQKGEFAYNHGASKIRPFGSCFTLNVPEARVPFVYHCFRITETTNHKFLELQLNGRQVEKQLKRLISSSARLDGLLNISFDDYMSVSFLSPTHNEQEKIGKLFERIDHLLNLQQSKCDKLNEIKKSMLTKMFPKPGQKVPEVRFEGFKDDWVECFVKDVCTIATGMSNTQDQTKNGIYPFFIRSDKPLKSNKYLYDCEAVITIGDGNIGKVFHYINGKFDLHQRCYKMTDFKYVIGKYFFYYFSTHFYERVIKMSAKATVDSVRLEMISDMRLLYPIDIEEQKFIASYFDKLDTLIRLTDIKLSKLRLLKRSLLDRMFV